MRLRDSVFEPHQIKAMSAAFDEVCEALKLDGSSAKKVMAARIIGLARFGECSPTRLSERVITRQAWLRGGEVGRLCSPKELICARHRVPNKSPADTRGA